MSGVREGNLGEATAENCWLAHHCLPCDAAATIWLLSLPSDPSAAAATITRQLVSASYMNAHHSLRQAPRMSPQLAWRNLFSRHLSQVVLLSCSPLIWLALLKKTISFQTPYAGWLPLQCPQEVCDSKRIFQWYLFGSEWLLPLLSISPLQMTGTTPCEVALQYASKDFCS